MKKVTLHNGLAMPMLGLGVWKMEHEEAVQSVKTAVQLGYRAIDTAAIYKNEAGVGQGIKECGIPREELFITTKVWNDDLGYEETLAAFEESLKKLQLDYLDLYLIHWPVAGKYKDAWRALEKLYKEKRVRAIGVCNFHQHHLENVMADAEIMPMINQIECHPLLSQHELREYCASHNIQVEAWSPLGQGTLLEHPVLEEIAETHNKSVAQVILRWDIQNNIITIPKSIKAHRIQENGEIFDFELSANEMARINALNKNERVGSNPEKYDV
ncbi:aldo/keto reductase [Bacillus massiliigorillae]|uniref:aldo/keto reductase n=1 Tax=Bacillus massiliigorillae TaxID=1243664 RepID=UPI0003A9AFA9|nr:aldo/keto reductase [Bacillus massiliigorillae]